MPVIETNIIKRSHTTQDKHQVYRGIHEIFQQTYSSLTTSYDEMNMGKGQEIPAYKLPSAQGAWCHVLSTIQLEIQNLNDLGEDWDLEGAKAVENKCIKRALSFVESLESKNVDTIRIWNIPSVTALLNGGVQLYWYTKSGQTYLNFQPSNADIFLQRVNQDGKGNFEHVNDERAVHYAMEAMNDL